MSRTSQWLLSVALYDYWQETITRDEAVRRVDERDLSWERRERVVARIPDRAEHLLTFHNAFREYLLIGGVAKLILALPVRHWNGAHYVIAPTLPDGVRLSSRAEPQPATIEQFVFTARRRAQSWR